MKICQVGFKRRPSYWFGGKDNRLLLCSGGVDAYFGLPAGCSQMTAVLTTSKPRHKDFYELRMVGGFPHLRCFRDEQATVPTLTSTTFSHGVRQFIKRKMAVAGLIDAYLYIEYDG